MDIPKYCDVVVIGGGPAGSIAGTSLAQKGYSVVLFDKAKHPRYQVGESIIPHVWKYCDLVGATEKMEAESFIRKAGGTVVWDGVIRQMAFKDFGYTRPALHVERDRFDYVLLENARQKGVQTFERVSVLGINRDAPNEVNASYRPTGESSPSEISCRYVVDASGQGAVISKQLGIRVIDEDFRFMSVWGYFADSKYVAADGKAYDFKYLRQIPPTTFISSLGNWGWSWHIPQKESTSVGVVIPTEQLKSLGAGEEALERYFLKTCRETPILSSLLENARYCDGSLHVIRDYSYRPTQVAGPGFFLTGDAAAFIDPIFSVGVLLAMYSGLLASWAVERCFSDSSRAEKSQALFSRQLLSRLDVARSLAIPCYSPSQRASDQAQSTIQFESSLEQELMYVVSTVTTRSENFLDMAQRKDGQKITSDKFRTLEEITY